jgi:hypothetical protein
MYFAISKKRFAAKIRDISRIFAANNGAFCRKGKQKQFPDILRAAWFCARRPVAGGGAGHKTKAREV